jgi:hypothetical protein
MIDSISQFATTVVELLQTGITGLVNAIAQVFNGEK